MRSFISHLPTEIIFGDGKFNALGEKASQLGK